MNHSISHDRSDESPEAKARWFQSLSMTERMELLCEITELALSRNPRLAERRDAASTSGRIRILSKE